MAKKTKKNKRIEQQHRDNLLKKKGNELLQKSAKSAYIKGIKMNNDILEGKIDIPSLNNVKLFKYQIQKLDQYFAELHQETHTYPTCKKGCSHCCSYPIWVSEFEIEAIKTWIKENIEDEMKEIIKNNLKEWEEKIIETAKHLQIAHKAVCFWVNNKQQGERLKKNEANRSALKDEYSKKQVNCPFLIDNSCSIYAVRPVTCRTYFAYGNPERCKKEIYPIGTLNFSCANRNIFLTPLFNMIKVLSEGDEKICEQKYQQIIVNDRLLPLWFSEDGEFFK